MTFTTRPFSVARKAPAMNLLLVDAGFPLVRLAGACIDTLREDIYDNARDVSACAKADIVSVYDIALCGGEPYAAWN